MWEPESIGPDDTVFVYTILNDFYNTLQKRSVGLLWSQLEPGQAIGEPGWPVSAADDRLRVEPNPCRGTATVRFSGPSSIVRRSSLSVYDATGRCMQSTICNLKSAMPLDLRSMPVGVYVARVETDGFTQTAKLIVER